MSKTLVRYEGTLVSHQQLSCSMPQRNKQKVLCLTLIQKIGHQI